MTVFCGDSRPHGPHTDFDPDPVRCSGVEDVRIDPRYGEELTLDMEGLPEPHNPNCSPFCQGDHPPAP